MRVVLRFWKTFSHSSFQENFMDFLSSWMEGWFCSESFGRNLDIMVRQPVTSLLEITYLK